MKVNHANEGSDYMRNSFPPIMRSAARLAGIASCGIAPWTSAATGDRPPNVIVIMTDDQGWGDLSLHGHQTLETPHIDRIGREGMRFTQAYSASVCSPTRTAIMTGQNPARHHVTNWTLFADRDQSGQEIQSKGGTHKRDQVHPYPSHKSRQQ